jgi:hypothetical protein
MIAGSAFGADATQKFLILRNIRAKRSVYTSAIMYRMGWTDQRMDDFAAHVDRRFDGIDKRLDRFEDRFDGLQRTLMLTGGGIIATLIAAIVSVLLTQL